MEIIRGKIASFMGSSALAERASGYDNIHIDVGTGDGRFVQHLAKTFPGSFAIGIDACRENLREASHSAPGNALFVIANALALPTELHGLADQITINFPWGSLLEGLLAGDTALLAGLLAISRPGARLEIRLNGEAVKQTGWLLEAGAAQVREALIEHGFNMRSPVMVEAHELRAYPTTWAKRLAFGRDPRAVVLRGSLLRHRHPVSGGVVACDVVR